jgi:endonuclease-3 related protein
MSNSRINEKARLLLIYDLLDAHFGDLKWWPGDSPFEVIVGAILTQNTAWRNVEIAIDHLKSKGALSPTAILGTPDNVLADLIRSAGYYQVKTSRLKSFVRFLYGAYGGNLKDMFSENLRTLRVKLLTIKGIGEETADSILLYGGCKPIFVVDAYTRRIFERHGIVRADATYGNIQNFLMTHLPRSVPLYNQYHALLVNTGKYFCRKTPRCQKCPLYLLI